ncbi:hypothetical protein J2Q11_13055 [Tenacibaculum finnmarkense genomovar finnmarkense]|uniref:hypothetical protein n=1 Tax=Tenacibaculum finnmarkense TaxID=2781243 RepID=UPI001E4084BB|nr:hypothetical protein [Tenacibaculum finnmarkense]MCD8418578.1 hypothetical protein [Tenacibaculum finnmarkense genomovar finnmarkense]MCG8186936.1 hypothetical protein [Tenacibaculum finnmarkense genomovar finnmarkense]MCG8203418.1 hypothetical protein [Tenacibaculum finnmarkense genomovar finnmarkense]MCG8210985.1 hypothetical protein [Tenacibaculum finnmarkense genomovar finnmarkense]MCG8213744.1 hypothetical protein [Tenacibaculum finnmarkense genomovar finnmarkense]
MEQKPKKQFRENLTTIGKRLLLLVSLTFFNCTNMNTNFTIEGPKEVLDKLHINIEYTDYQEKWHSFTTYHKGNKYKKNVDEILAYGVSINYNNTLFFEDYSDFNPDYFNYLGEKKIFLKKEGESIYAKVVFFKEDDHKESGFTKLLTLEDFFKKNKIVEDSIKNNYEKSFKEILIP